MDAWHNRETTCDLLTCGVGFLVLSRAETQAGLKCVLANPGGFVPRPHQLREGWAKSELGTIDVWGDACTRSSGACCEAVGCAAAECHVALYPQCVLWCGMGYASATDGLEQQQSLIPNQVGGTVGDGEQKLLCMHTHTHPPTHSPRNTETSAAAEVDLRRVAVAWAKAAARDAPLICGNCWGGGD